jgi:hypothetical protein
MFCNGVHIIQPAKMFLCIKIKGALGRIGIRVGLQPSVFMIKNGAKGNKISKRFGKEQFLYQRQQHG